MFLPLQRIWCLLVGREVDWGCEATELDRFVASFLPIFTCSVSLQENHLVMFCILTPLIKYILSDQSQTIQDQIVGGLSEGGWFYVASSRQREKGGRIALRRASSSELVRLLQGFESQGSFGDLLMINQLNSQLHWCLYEQTNDIWLNGTFSLLTQPNNSWSTNV